jgi:hypothetical protein
MVIGYRKDQHALVKAAYQSESDCHDPRPTESAVDAIHAAFLDGLPLTDLKTALGQCASPKSIRLLSALDDPSKSHMNRAVLARSCGISLKDLTVIWRNHCLAQAMNVMIDAAPDIAADIVEDAKSRPACCPRCDGAGTIHVSRPDGPSWIQCTNCNGTGAVRKPGDGQSRDLLLKAIGIVKADSSSRVTIMNPNSVSMESLLDELEHLGAAATIAPTD